MANNINDSGYKVEAIVENFLVGLHLPIVDRHEKHKNSITVVKKANYPRWNGKNGQMDFVITLLCGRRIFIEVKGQKGGGSVEDKYLTSLHDVFSAARQPGDIGILLIHNQMDIVKNQLAISPQTIQTLNKIAEQMFKIGYLSFDTMTMVKRDVFVLTLEEFFSFIPNVIDGNF